MHFRIDITLKCFKAVWLIAVLYFTFMVLTLAKAQTDADQNPLLYMYIEVDQRRDDAHYVDLETLDLETGEIQHITDLHTMSFEGQFQGWTLEDFSGDGGRTVASFSPRGDYTVLGISALSEWQPQEVSLPRHEDEYLWAISWLPGDRFIAVSYERTVHPAIGGPYAELVRRVLIDANTLEVQSWPYRADAIGISSDTHEITMQWILDSNLRSDLPQSAPYAFYNLEDQSMTFSDTPLELAFYVSDRSVTFFEQWIWDSAYGYIWYYDDVLNPGRYSPLEEGFYAWQVGQAEPTALSIPLPYWTELRLSPDAKSILFEADLSETWKLFGLDQQQVTHTFPPPEQPLWPGNSGFVWIGDNRHFVYTTFMFPTEAGNLTRTFIHRVSLDSRVEQVFEIEGTINRMVYPK